MSNTIKINSSVIKEITHVEDRKDLKVTFKSNKVYVYTPVSKEFFDKLKNSASKGLFFNVNIKNNQALTCLKVIK